MKCFYHMERDASGMCAQCGKAACGECLEDVGGALLCHSCEKLAQQDAAAEHEMRGKKAKKRIQLINFLTIPCVIGAVPLAIAVAAKGGIIGFFGGLVGAVLGIYCVWATIWGLFHVLPWLKHKLSNSSFFIFLTPAGRVILLFATCYLVLIGAILYGVLGGALHQYLHYRQMAMNAT